MKTLVGILLSFCFAGAAFAEDGPTPKDLRYPYVTLIGKICMKSNPLICDEIVITNSEMSGVMDQLLAFDPAEPKNWKKYTVAPVPLTIFGCSGVQGLDSIQHYLKTNRMEAEYHVSGWKCQWGNRKIAVDKRV